MLKYHIQTVELTSAQSAIQFNSIPQDYDDLYVVWSTRYVSEATTKTSILFNNSSSNFSYRLLQGDGSAAASGANTLALGGINNGSTTTANTFSNNQMLVSNYKSNIAKSYSVDAVSENNATSSFEDIWTGLWNNSAPITNLTITGSSALAIGSSVSLYGVRRGSDGKTSPVAQGGIVTTSGGYTIHTFNTSGTLTAFRPLECEYLVVAGGGAGSGSRAGGGGGAGGFRTSSAALTSGTNYTVTVGAGASGVSGGAGSNGSSSSFNSLESAGGGGGGVLNGPGSAGGSGGGGGASQGGVVNAGGAGNTPSTSPSQGSAGGGGTTSWTRGGGGGGAGATGATGTAGGAGGSGSSSSITGTAVTRAGGGGGGLEGSGSGGSGGAGGGGIGGSSNTSPGAGTANTGGGGGGHGQNAAGGNGGSGVVIIRYLTP